MRTCIALALCALCFGLAAAQENYDSTGQVVRGFTIVSNVTGYMRMSLDACEIRANVLATRPNFERAAFVYRNGSNAIRPDGRTRRLLTGWTAGDHATGHPYYQNASALFNETNWIGSIMNAALDPASPLSDGQRAIMAINTVSLQLPLSYMMAEMYAIAEEIDPAGTNVTATGAPHALDEGFGVYVGAPSECSPFNYIEQASAMFGTLASCNSSAINEMIIEQFNAAQAAILSGNVAGYEAARDNIIRSVQVALIQNVLARARVTERMARNALRAEVAALDYNDHLLEDADADHLAGGMQRAASLENATMLLGVAKADSYTVYRALAGFVHMYNPMAAAALNHYLGVNTPVSRGHYAHVQVLLHSLMPAMGITPDMVGTYGDELEGCESRRR